MTSLNPAGHGGAIRKRGAMAKVIKCQCGFVGRGETPDDAADRIEHHMRAEHPEMVGRVARDDLLAMAEEE